MAGIGVQAAKTGRSKTLAYPEGHAFCVTLQHSEKEVRGKGCAGERLRMGKEGAANPAPAKAAARLT